MIKYIVFVYTNNDNVPRCIHHKINQKSESLQLNASLTLADVEDEKNVSGYKTK